MVNEEKAKDSSKDSPDDLSVNSPKSGVENTPSGCKVVIKEEVTCPVGE